MSATPGPKTPPPSGQDALGRPLTPVERRLVTAYEGLRALLEEELPPCAAANVKEALAALWQAVHDLALLEDRPDV